jgi:hypothetical protein
METFEYNFKTDPVSYDFLVWLCGVTTRTQGEPFRLIINKASVNTAYKGMFRQSQGLVYSQESMSQLLFNVMLPAIEMFPVAELFLFPQDMKGIKQQYTTHIFNQLGLPVKGLTVPKWANDYVLKHHGSGYIVINLRTCEHRPLRNSNLADWSKFVSYLKYLGHRVIILPDTNAPHSVNEFPDLKFNETALEASTLAIRSALYENAKCVLGVNCGAMAPAWHNPKVNYVTYKPITEEISTHESDYVSRDFSFVRDKFGQILSMSAWPFAWHKNQLT